MKRIDLYTFIVVSHRVFIKKQSFLDFLCEVMLHSPSGKWRYNGNRNVRKAEMEDVVKFFDRQINDGYYDGEVEFLLKHCQSKYFLFYLKTNYLVRNKIFLYTHK